VGGPIFIDQARMGFSTRAALYKKFCFCFDLSTRGSICTKLTLMVFVRMAAAYRKYDYDSSHDYLASKTIFLEQDLTP